MESAATARRELPEGWERKVDGKYNRTYYYHKQTRKSSWHFPTSTNSILKSQAPADGDVWIKVYSKSRPTQFYYHNRLTGQNTWKHPTKQASSVSSTCSSSPSNSVASTNFVQLDISTFSLDDSTTPSTVTDVQALLDQLARERTQLRIERDQLETAKREFEREKLAFYGTQTTPRAQEDYYSVLGVSQNCSAKELKLAYRKQLIESHPDKVAPEHKLQAESRIVALQTAYKTLSSTWERGIYDWFGLEMYMRNVSVLENFKQLLVSGNLEVYLVKAKQRMKMWMEAPDFKEIKLGKNRNAVELVLAVDSVYEIVATMQRFCIYSSHNINTLELECDSAETCESISTRLKLLMIDLKQDQDWLYRHYDAAE